MTTESTTVPALNEPRLIAESGQEAQIAALLEPEITSLGFRLVRIRLTQINGMTLQIMAERPDGSMSVTDCEAISRGISPILDIEDPIHSEYHLEISSPGIDRPLVRISDFENWAGHVAKLETHQLVDGRKRYKGTILGVEGDKITFRRESIAEGENENFILSASDIAEAKLILSDDLIREALQRDKALRKANGVEDGTTDTDETDTDS
ncbi:MAG: ribosome maturation factor RimP [Rhizobiales bacterium]|nr:ribosome maturation factor RimP [Hyphomicrobiales bacterium]